MVLRCASGCVFARTIFRNLFVSFSAQKPNKSVQRNVKRLLQKLDDFQCLFPVDTNIGFGVRCINQAIKRYG